MVDVVIGSERSGLDLIGLDCMIERLVSLTYTRP